MAHTLFNLINSYSDRLNSSDEWSLREVLKDLEERFRSEFKERIPEFVIQQLWLQLIDVSIELDNIDLSLLAVAKLKQTQLAILVQSTLQSRSLINKLISFLYITSYFQIDFDFMGKLPSVNDLSKSEQELIIELLIDKCDWKLALKFIDQCEELDNHTQELRKRSVFYKIAETDEVDTDYNSALKYYKISKTRCWHQARVIIKKHLNYAFSELKIYCKSISDKNLQAFWQVYSNTCNCDVTSSEEKIAEDESIPKEVTDFVNDPSASKWLDISRCKDMITCGSDLNIESKDSLIRLAKSFQQSYQLEKAAILFLYTNQIDSFLNVILEFLDKQIYLILVSNLSSQEKVSAILIDHLIIDKLTKGNNLVSKRVGHDLFEVYLKLGLIDEALQELSKDSQSMPETKFYRAIEHLKLSIEDRHLNVLNHIDPELKQSTLVSVQKLLSDNQLLTTHSITILILSISIFIYKLRDEESVRQISRLETMFNQLTYYIDELNFNASEVLVSSTNCLIAAAKEKLDILTDSDIVRDGLGRVVEALAGRCMIEGQYKNAAMLYSSIEDNVNAIKSLMRTGDINIVVNYSLLVSDITVNRITINYLKHSNADPAVIQDFITRTKQL